MLAGYPMVVLGITCFVLSYRRREPVKLSIVFVVLFFYVFFQFVLV